MIDLPYFLNQVLTTGISGTVAWYLIENVRFLVQMPMGTKPYLAFGLSALLVVLAYLAQVVMLYVPTPLTGQAWAEALFPLFAYAFTVSQAVYWGTKQELAKIA